MPGLPSHAALQNSRISAGNHLHGDRESFNSLESALGGASLGGGSSFSAASLDASQLQGICLGPNTQRASSHPRDNAPSEGVSARLAHACQSTLLGRTLQQFGGIVQVITEGEHPFRVLSISAGWLRLTGYLRDEVLGRTLKMLQGPLTGQAEIEALMQAVRLCCPVSVRLVNYDKQGRSFEHQLSVEPLRDPSGHTRCFQATSLVLRKPGERSAGESSLVAGPIPLVCTDPMPPLWPLLGRAVRPDHASAHVRSPTTWRVTAGPTEQSDDIDDEILTWLQSDKTEDSDLNTLIMQSR